MPEQHIQNQFTVAPNPTVVAATPAGSITVRGEYSHSVEISAIKRGTEEQLAHTHVDIRQDGNDVRARVHGHGNLAVVDFEIRVPENCTVRAETASGTIEISDIEGSVDADSASGTTVVRTVHGQVDLHTASGPIDASDIQGNITVNTASGDVHVHDSHLTVFQVQSASGNVTLETPLDGEEPSSINTASGDVTLVVPDATHADLALHSASGTIESDGAADVVQQRRGTATLRLGNGGTPIAMTSASGTLRVVHGGPRHVPEYVEAGRHWETAPAEASGENATAVLAALERGEISVDDAMARLDQI